MQVNQFWTQNNIFYIFYIFYIFLYIFPSSFFMIGNHFSSLETCLTQPYSKCSKIYFILLSEFVCTFLTYHHEFFLIFSS